MQKIIENLVLNASMLPLTVLNRAKKTEIIRFAMHIFDFSAPIARVRGSYYNCKINIISFKRINNMIYYFNSA